MATAGRQSGGARGRGWRQRGNRRARGGGGNDMERSRLGSFAKRGLWDADVNSERISIERLLDVYLSSLFFYFFT